MRSTTVAALGLSAFLVGCQQPSMHDMMTEMLKPKPRAPELAKLDAWEGTWNGQATCTSGEESLSGKGSSEIRWMAGKTVMVEEMTHTMDGIEGEMKGVSVMWWDEAGGTYRTFMVMSDGSYGMGTMKHDDAKDEWTMKTKSHSAHGDTTGKGTIVMPNDGASQWTWTEYDGLGLFKLMEMSGRMEKQ
jgi:hypothetical protein